MVRRVLTAFVIVAGTAAFAAAAIVGSLVRPGSDVTFRLARSWARMILRTAGISVRAEGRDRIEESVPCVFMANHRSAADVWVLALTLPDASCFVAKRSLFRVPLLGWAMAAGGFVAIDRQNRSRALEGLSLAARRLREGKSLVVFPEGTRSRDGVLLPFKKGPFHLALSSGRPIVPVAISGTRRVLPPGSLGVRSGSVLVRFAPPVDPALYRPDEIARLVSDVRDAISRLVEEDA